MQTLELHYRTADARALCRADRCAERCAERCADAAPDRLRHGRQQHLHGRRRVALGRDGRSGDVRPHFDVGDFGGDGHVAFVLRRFPRPLRSWLLQHSRSVL